MNEEQLKQQLQSAIEARDTAYNKAADIRQQVNGTTTELSKENQTLWANYLTESEKQDSIAEGIKLQLKLLTQVNAPINPLGSVPDAPVTMTEDQLYQSAMAKLIFDKPNSLQSFTEDEQRLFSSQVLTNPSAGGYLATPERFITELLKDLDKDVFIRQMSRQFNVFDASSLGAVQLDDDLDDADWTGEITETTASEVTLGKRSLAPNYLTKEVTISRALANRTNIEALIRERLAYKFGITQEKAFINGTGVGQPLGVMTASDNGISTARDYTTGTAEQVDAEDILNMAYEDLDDKHFNKSTWLISKALRLEIRKMKDDNNNFIWQEYGNPGQQLTGGNPGVICGRPYVTSDYVTGQTAGAWVADDYVAVLGDFNYYWIVNFMQMEVQMLNELYARTNRLGVIGRMMADGAPVLESAFVRMKVA